MDWIPTELHSHTVHSDGDMTPEVLADEAARAGFGALALTDHNTDSGRGAFSASAHLRGLTPIPGVELTTFFGHVLLWGSGPAPDWRFFGPHELGRVLKTVPRETLAVGAAHPFRPGNPFCTGCHWDYDLTFDELDCLEVWSGLDPDLSADNHRALALWDRLLNQGIRITATAGRDWHRNGATGLKSTTYLGVPAGYRTAESAERALHLVQALKAGRAVVSLGPLAEVARTDSAVSLSVSDPGWGLALGLVRDPVVSLVSDRGALGSWALQPMGGRFELPHEGTPPRWVRAEVRGEWGGRVRLLAFTNPV